MDSFLSNAQACCTCGTDSLAERRRFELFLVPVGSWIKTEVRIEFKLVRGSETISNEEEEEEKQV